MIKLVISTISMVFVIVLKDIILMVESANHVLKVSHTANCVALMDNNAHNALDL